MDEGHGTCACGLRHVDTRGIVGQTAERAGWLPPGDVGRGELQHPPLARRSRRGK